MYEFVEHDDIYISTRASSGEQVIVSISVLFNDGTAELFQIDANPMGDYGLDEFFLDLPFEKPGRVVGISADVRGSAVRRGENYMRIFIRRALAVTHLNCIASFYVTSDFFGALGFFEPSVGGRGFLSWVEVFHDRAGNAVAVDFPLAATNTQRLIYGLAWYYHCSSDVATRTMSTPRVNGLGGVKPTGFTLTGTNAMFWNSGTNISLTADEEGAIVSYAAEGKDGLTATLDNGVRTVANAATLPTPWPLWVTPDDVDSIIRFPSISSGEAADRHSAYVLIEEWIEQ